MDNKKDRELNPKQGKGIGVTSTDKKAEPKTDEPLCEKDEFKEAEEALRIRIEQEKKQ